MTRILNYEKELNLIEPKQLRIPEGIVDFVLPALVKGCYNKKRYSCVFCNINEEGIMMVTKARDIILENASFMLSELGEKDNHNACSFRHVVDISYFTDFLYTWDFYGWEYVIKYMSDIENCLPTASTRFVNNDLLNLDVSRFRVKVCLVPEYIINNYERFTSNLEDRINFINTLHRNTVYNLQVEFSPIIIYDGWLNDFISLLRMVRDNLSQSLFDEILFSYRFLEYSEISFNYNMQDVNGNPAAKTLWDQENQIKALDREFMIYSDEIVENSGKTVESLIKRILPKALILNNKIVK